MPIYEFQCQSCGYEFEHIQSFSDTNTPVCPQCKSESVQRRVSRPSIHFKGSGWYITDSKSDSKKEGKKEGDGKKADEKPSGESDTKKSEGDAGKASSSESTAKQSSETASKASSSEKSSKSTES